MSNNKSISKLIDHYKSSPAPGFIMGCLVGLLFFLAVFGGRIIDPTYVDWLLHSDDLEGSVDLTQHYLGWVYYRNTPWQFPLGLTEGIYSSPISVIYTDSIPLFAFIFKLLSPILPTDFQYFGLYGLMCYCLMGGFAVLLVRRVCGDPLFHLAAAVLFVCNPVMLNRMYLHTALAGHFLILAGLCLFFYQQGLNAVSRVARWTLLITLGTLINAYFTPMLYGLLVFSVIGDIMSKNATEPPVKLHPYRLKLLGLPALSTALSCYLFGMFYGSVPAGAGGLEVLSFNLNGFFNPMTKLTAFHDHFMGYRDMNYSRWLPALPMSTAYQNEGFAYMGIGVIILILLVILILVSKPVSGIAYDYDDMPPASCRNFLFVFMIICLILALSPVATLGEIQLYHLPLPEFMHSLWSSFRSTARFIWPVYYCILAMTLFAVGRLLSTRDKRPSVYVIYLMLLSTVLLQLFDLTPGFIEKHEAFSVIKPYQSTLTDPMWDELGKEKSHIIFYPPTEYGLYEDGKTSVEFEIYGLKYGLTLNNSYMSRNLCSFADENTLTHFETMAAGESYPDNIYVFFDCIGEDELPDPDVYGLKYYKLDKYIIGCNARYNAAP